MRKAMLPFLLASASYSADSLGDIYEDTAHAATSYRADTRKLANPCLSAPFAALPFCNASLPSTSAQKTPSAAFH